MKRETGFRVRVPRCMCAAGGSSHGLKPLSPCTTEVHTYAERLQSFRATLGHSIRARKGFLSHPILSARGSTMAPKRPFLSPAPSGNGFSWYSTAEDAAKGVDLSGKTVIVTGANSGIGKESARVMAQHGAFVVFTSRDMQKGEEAKNDMVKGGAPAENLLLMQLDLASFDSIRKFAESFKALGRPLHILLNNAGVMMCPWEKTKDGFEMQTGTNDIGHFLLTHLVFDCIKKAGPGARIVNVASIAHHYADKTPQTAQGIVDQWFHVPQNKYNTSVQYGRSKVGNIWFTNELQRRFGDDGITCISLHPGVIATNLGRHIMGGRFNAVSNWLAGIFIKDVPKGAATSVFAACNPIAANYGGKYLDCCCPVEPTDQALNMNDAKLFWEACEMATGVKW